MVTESVRSTLETEREAYIRVEIDGKSVNEYPLNKPVLTIGRLPSCDISIDNQTISRKHAKVCLEGGMWVIEDTNSANGVTHQGLRVSKCVFANPDRVYLASTIVLCYQETEKISYLEQLRRLCNPQAEADTLVQYPEADQGDEETLKLPSLGVDSSNGTHPNSSGSSALGNEAFHMEPLPIPTSVPDSPKAGSTSLKGGSWTLTTMPTFQAELLTAQDSYLLEQKISMLVYDPSPDGKVKKTLTDSSKELCMLRAGNYWVFYAIQKPYIRLLALRHRQTFASSNGLPSAQEMAQLLKEPHTSDSHQEAHLPTILLRLTPEQEKAITWEPATSGPVQIKGKPGTGKSMVALYRIRSFIQKQTDAGQPAPRVLFTTYTNALIETSKQLLEQLLGTQKSCVEVLTADSLITRLLKERPQEASSETLSELLQKALQQVLPEDDKRRKFLSKLSEEYLLEEINQVLIARRLTEASYIAIERTGRKVPLSRDVERRIIWSVYKIFNELLRQSGKETWSQWRVRAEDYFKQQLPSVSYDAVFVDEAQDLEPSALRVLLALCKKPENFFITADANQSIYSKSFSWSDVHEDLNFQRRTTILKTNYRSTRQIGEAAQSYLQAGAGEIDEVEWTHANTGPLPLMRATAHLTQEVQMLTAFLNKVTQSLNVGLQSCAVFCPTNQGGKQLAQELDKRGIKATFQPGRDVDLSAPGVKVLTLHSSKGLEFPIVALAGFHGSPYARAWGYLSDDEREEKLAQARRVLFVGMTRAMKSLLVLVPNETHSPLFTGFNPTYWNVVESKGGQ